MTKPFVHTVHERRASVTISKPDLERMIQDYAMNLVGFSPIATRVEISFEDHKEGGSLPYKTGTKCVVKLTEDQQMLPSAV